MMNTAWVNVSVLAFWLTMMSWLVTQKVLPVLLVGEPPSHRTILAARQEDPSVGWSMRWNDREIGWAVSRTERLSDGMAEIHSRVHFAELPLREMTPQWLQRLLFNDRELAGRLQMDLKNTVVFDALETLSRFEVAVSFPPDESLLRITGHVADGTLQVTMRAGQLERRQELQLNPKTLLGDGISPQTHLPGLRAGQTWTVVIFNPLVPSDKPSEILQAIVEGRETTEWDGQVVETWLVVYRSHAGTAADDTRPPRGKLWVTPEGRVIKQQAALLDATLTFVRLGPSELAELAP
jgi:hypothetical protein